MAKTDRALQAFARSAPEAVVSLLRLHAQLPLPDAPVQALDLLDTQLTPPTLVADWVARVGTEVLHVEWQGYRDPRFLDRLFGYHLVLALRHPENRIRTVAVWLRTPKAHERLGVIERGDVSVRVEHVVLAEIPARSLLASGHACFAPGAALDGWAEDELCDVVVRRLAPTLPHPGLAVAVVVATAAGRYTAMRNAMQRAQIEPVLYLDLLEVGLDEGHRKGLDEGHRKGLDEGHRLGELAALRDVVRQLAASRGWSVEAVGPRVEAESSPAVLHRWIGRLPTAASLDEALGD